jgi:hypothetical protein
MHITISAPQGSEPQALSRSARQVAQAVKRAMAEID